MVALRRPAMAALLVLLGSVPGAAQQTNARAYLDRNPVALNQQFTLSFEVTGVQQLDADPGFPQLDLFARYLGNSTVMSNTVVNGRATVSYTIKYRFQATREGNFEVPALSVSAGGTVLRTEPLPVTVTATPQGAAEDVFLIASASKGSVYENEPFIVEYRIFTRVNIESYTLLSPSSVEGFWVEEIPMSDGPAVEQVVRNGISYTSAVLRRVALFPTGAGSRAIQPMSVEARVRIQRRGGLLEDVFGGRLFGSLTPVTVTSEPVEIEVRPLPTADRPLNFTGIVGSLAVDASVDRAELEANDAVTLTLRVSGEGNLRGLAPPELDLAADFEVFEPEVSENITPVGGVVRGSKTFEYVLIPRAPGTRSIPAVELSYFSAAENRYATATSEAISLEVTGDTPTLPGTGLRAGVATLREDIRFIRDVGPPLRPEARPLHRTGGFWVVALLPLLAMVAALGVRTHRDRLEGDVGYARGRRASQLAKKRLARAKELVDDTDSGPFYAEVSRALQGFLADKMNLPEAGLMMDHAAEALRNRDVADGVARPYLDCLERCDRQRFAPSPHAPGERSHFLEEVEKAMTALNQSLR